MSRMSPEIVSVGRRLTDVATLHPDKTALIFAPLNGDDIHVSWEELERQSNQYARFLSDKGVGEKSTVAIGLPNCIEHVLTSFGVWKLGGTVLPLRWDMPARELAALLELTSPDLVAADWDEGDFGSVERLELRDASSFDDRPLPDRIPNPGTSMTSGGSTGRPKIIARTSPLGFPPGALSKMFEPFNFRPGMTSLINSPLYHAAGLFPLIWGLFEGCTVVFAERFEPANVLRLIEKYQIHFVNAVPIMMQRLLDVPDIKKYDLSSVISLAHGGAPCASWIKQAWFEILGPEQVVEALMATETNGFTVVNGKEWLEHPGSVGKPYLTEIEILDDQQNKVPAGEVGMIYARSTLSRELPFVYIGSDQAPSTSEGFTTVGDLGWIDEEGYVYLADRRTDLIISGGANVFAAEVEAALSEHPGVADVVVVGLPDETWGKRVHAIIQPHDIDEHPANEELNAWCRERLSVYKCPKTYEFIVELPRNEAGKIRRSAMAAERSEISAAVTADD